MIILIDALAVIVLILGWWIALSSYPHLPEKIPVHFGITGQPDGWGGKWMIFLLPAIATMILVFEYSTFKYGIVKTNRPVPEAAMVPLRLLMLELSVIFTYGVWRMSEVAFGRASGLGVWFLPVTVIVLLATSAWMWLAGRGN